MHDHKPTYYPTLAARGESHSGRNGPSRPTSSLRYVAIVLIATLTGCGSTPDPQIPPSSPAHALLERSLDFHDPDRVWGQVQIPIQWTSTRPDGRVGFDYRISFEPNGAFLMRGERAGHEIDYRVNQDFALVQVDGSEQVSDELLEKLVLSRDNGLFWRDYLGFLGSMPMCLQFPEVKIEPSVTTTRLEEQDVLSIRAGFSPEDGTDTWTFYFDPETAQLVGCRFDKQDPTKNGETLLFEGTSAISGILIPRTRRWYVNKDQRFLGTDELRAPE